MSNAYRVATKEIKSNKERNEENPEQVPWNATLEKSLRRDVISTHSCLRSDINVLGARRDSLIFSILKLSHDPEIFKVQALVLAREADTIVKTINLLSDGEYKRSELVEGDYTG